MSSSKYGDLIAAIVEKVEKGKDIPQGQIYYRSSWRNCIHTGGLRVIHSELHGNPKKGIWVEFVGTGLTVSIIQSESLMEPEFQNRIVVTVEGQGFSTVVDKGELSFKDKATEATLDRILAKITDMLAAWSKRKSAAARAKQVLTAAISII